MPRFKIFAERVTVELAEVEAENEQQAREIAEQLTDWEPCHDSAFQITSIQEQD